LISPASPYRIKRSPFSSHGRILKYLAARPREIRILEVGTAEGYLGRALREAGFTRLTGLEENPAAAEIARPVYSEMVRADLESWEPAPSMGPFDVILCADVLEHLKDPWGVLKKLAGMLAPQGRLLLSVPNSGHGWMRLNILLGRFPLEDRGLFDRGHLRFFTWGTLQDLVGRAGLRVEKTWITPPPLSDLCGAGTGRRIAVGLEAVYCAVGLLWKKLFAYQFVLCAASRAP